MNWVNQVLAFSTFFIILGISRRFVRTVPTGTLEFTAEILSKSITIISKRYTMEKITTNTNDSDIYNTRNVDKSLSEYLYLKTGEYCYENFVPISYSNDFNGKIFLEFYVKSARDAIILFSTNKNPAKDEPVYEIVIGGSTNTRVFIQRLQDGEDLKVKQIHGILSPVEWRGFWIRITVSGIIQVGYRNSEFPFISWKDPEPLFIKYLSFSSWWGTNAEWAYHHLQEKDYSSSMYEFLSTEEYKFEDFVPVPYGNNSKAEILLEFHVMTPRDAILLFSTKKNPSEDEPVYEIAIGASNNSYVYIRRLQCRSEKKYKEIHGIVSADEWRGFWIRITKTGLIHIGYRDSEFPFISWKDPEPLDINYISFSSWWESYADWGFRFLADKDDPLSKYEYLVTNEYFYENFVSVPHVNSSNDEILLEFYVKTARDAFILFSTNNNPGKDEPVYEINIGGATNTRIFIRRLQDGENVESTEIHGIVSADEWRGFWIRITVEGLIQIGYRDSDLALISWKDPEPLFIKYSSFSSWCGSDAEWAYRYLKEEHN